MNLDFSNDQKFLQEEARKFLEKEEALNRNRSVFQTGSKTGKTNHMYNGTGKTFFWNDFMC